VRHQACSLSLVCVLLQILSGQHASAQINPHVSLSDRTSSMPFDLREGFLIVVEGRVGPIEHLRFILDTGSSRTIVSQKIADQFTLSRQPALVIALDNKGKLESAIFPEVQIGPLRVVNQPMIVGNLAKVSEFGTNVDAILGLDILSRCKALEIDYAAREVRFVTHHSGSDERHASTNAFFVPAVLERRPIRLLVDTGMQGVVLFEDRLRSHVGKWESMEKVSMLMGSVRIQQVRMQSLLLGPFQIKAPVFILPGRSTFPEVMDGALGPRALGATRIMLDFDDMKFRFR